MASTQRASLVIALVVAAGCTDPVRDAEIAALGGEDPAVPPGPDHRPGQACVTCHSVGGPASKHPFALAGTIWKDQTYNSDPADRITIQFVDARGGAPRELPETQPSGNFYVPTGDWPDIAFPVRVAIYEDAQKAPTQTMQSLIGREGSCNACHARNPNPEGITKEELDNSARSAGQIYVTGGVAK